MFLTLLAGIANAVLDYVLIVPMGMGIAGAAIATVTGYSIPALIGLIYLPLPEEPVVRTAPHCKRSWEKPVTPLLPRDGDQPFRPASSPSSSIC